MTNGVSILWNTFCNVDFTEQIFFIVALKGLLRRADFPAGVGMRKCWIVDSLLSPAFKFKHRKNCECCPGQSLSLSH